MTSEDECTFSTVVFKNLEKKRYEPCRSCSLSHLIPYTIQLINSAHFMCLYSCHKCSCFDTKNKNKKKHPSARILLVQGNVPVKCLVYEYLYKIMRYVMALIFCLILYLTLSICVNIHNVTY